MNNNNRSARSTFLASIIVINSCPVATIVNNAIRPNSPFSMPTIVFVAVVFSSFSYQFHKQS